MMERELQTKPICDKCSSEASSPFASHFVLVDKATEEILPHAEGGEVLRLRAYCHGEVEICELQMNEAKSVRLVRAFRVGPQLMANGLGCTAITVSRRYAPTDGAPQIVNLELQCKLLLGHEGDHVAKIPIEFGFGAGCDLTFARMPRVVIPLEEDESENVTIEVHPETLDLEGGTVDATVSVSVPSAPRVEVSATIVEEEKVDELELELDRREDEAP